MSPPPVAAADPRATTVHGDTRVDPYGWLRDRDDPRTLAYLEAENRWTEEVMAPTAALQESLYQELVARLVETDQTVPVLDGGFFYYSRLEKGRQYPVYCRKRGALDAPEETILDLDALAREHRYLRPGVLVPSPDHRLLAATLDVEGDDLFTLWIDDLETGETVERIPGVCPTVAWSADGRHVFYVIRDRAKRPDIVRRHELGTDPGADAVVFHETDDAFVVTLSRTRSRRFVRIESRSHAASEVRLLEAADPLSTARVVRPRKALIEYQVDHLGEHLYVVTNDAAKDFRLMRVPVDDPSAEAWEEVLPHRPGVTLEHLVVLRGHWIVFERRDGRRRVRVHRLETGDEHELAFPETSYCVWPGENPALDRGRLRIGYSSLVTPESVYEVDLESRERVLLKREAVPGYDPALYTSERIEARAGDGVAVPVSLVYRRGLELDGRNPCLLSGYGAYGVSGDPEFRASGLCLLDRGFVVAIAHVRGTGALGERWHGDGKLLAKPNTFSDFVAVAEHLVAAGYTSKERLAIRGASAGGLLIGAVLNQRPDLCAAALAEVPFVDVLNSMLDPSLPLTVIEYDEWGDPRQEPFYRVIRAYSPYDNVAERDYPHLLITAGLNDPRVPYWEPAKWTARLRSFWTGDRRLLLRTAMDSGHSGPSGRYEALREVALSWAFLLDVLGLEKPETREPG